MQHVVNCRKVIYLRAGGLRLLGLPIPLISSFCKSKDRAVLNCLMVVGSGLVTAARTGATIRLLAWN